MDNFIEKYCLGSDLSTPDPYDIWKTSIGLRVKKLFYTHRSLGILPAALLTVFDTFCNNQVRCFYTMQEYPIVRALAAMILMNLYTNTRDQRYVSAINAHVSWLLHNPSRGYHGYGWGLGFEHPVNHEISYSAHAPFSTITPYVLEALIQCNNLFPNEKFLDTIEKIYQFFELDICVMEETDDYLVTSYGPLRDRVVTNAVSYTMYSYSLLRAYFPQRRNVIDGKILKIFNFIKIQQQDNGAWLYSPYGTSFVDCFHSCIVLKNLIKTHAAFPLPGSHSMIMKGYNYLKENFFDERQLVFKRFSIKNKSSIVKFDLYDNAEMMNLGMLLGDVTLVNILSDSITKVFVDKEDIYSQIDITGTRRNKNMLRWAVMPFLYAVSQRFEYGRTNNG